MTTLVSALSLPLVWPFLVVFDPSLEAPFNNWSRQHTLQGFSRRRGSVSFMTLEGVGPVPTEVWLVDEVAVAPESIRAIVVPFFVPVSGKVEVAGSDRGEVVAVPPGEYGLLYETGLDGRGEQWVRFSFVSGWAGEAAVLRADAVLSPAQPLLMEAEPA